MWSFSSWQLHNCSVQHNVMCAGTVTVLGKCDKMLDDACLIGVQVSNIYFIRICYFCICHVEIIEFGSLITLVLFMHCLLY